MLRLFCSFLLVVTATAQATPRKITDLKPSVLLISIDGFRWDYLQHFKAPNLTRLMKEGSSAEALIPSFPTKTFPNHYTIVTGLYPAHHGMVTNHFFDPVSQKKFDYYNRETVKQSEWWGGEPIWVTAEKAGQKTAPMFWPGSEARIAGVSPTYVVPFEGKMPRRERLNQFLTWLDKPQQDRPSFFTLYFNDVDDAGHEFGPDSAELRTAIKRVDQTIGVLLGELRSRGIRDKLNIVIVSDHGMSAADPQNNIFLDDYLDLASVRISDWNPVLMLDAGNANEEIISKLRRAPHITVYRKQELPPRLHFTGTDRIPPVIAIAEPGWTITSHKRLAERKKSSRGDHGYDNAVRDMWGIFIAQGPAFRSKTRIPPFENIHIYSALCSILGLQPAPNDGSPSVLEPVLRAPALPPQQTTPRTSAPRTAPAVDHRSQTAAQ